MLVLLWLRKIICWAFLGLYLIGQLRHERGERGMTFSKGPQVGAEPRPAASRTEPPYMGACSKKVSYPDALVWLIFLKLKLHLCYYREDKVLKKQSVGSRY